MVTFQRAAAVFPVADVASAIEHYRSLGFTVDAYDDPPTYAFAQRDDVSLHLARVETLDPSTSMTSVYLYVSDADALAAEWASSPGRQVPPRDTDYGLREGAHVDPDGNLIRFGSRPATTAPEEWDRDALFDDDYLHFYARIFDEAKTDTEAALVWEMLALEPGDAVLDLACGHGRIANRLAERGATVVGLDATPSFLELAREDARQRGVAVSYVQRDIRELDESQRFDAVVSWFTAYGYFDDETNRDVLRRVQRALRPGGRFLVELNHKDGLLPLYLPSTVGRLGDDLLIDEPHYDPLTGRSTARRTTLRNGERRERTYFVRMFSFTELRDWLLQAGFRSVDGYAGDGTQLVATSRRMILVAGK